MNFTRDVKFPEAPPQFIPQPTPQFIQPTPLTQSAPQFMQPTPLMQSAPQHTQSIPLMQSAPLTQSAPQFIQSAPYTSGSQSLHMNQPILQSPAVTYADIQAMVRKEMQVAYNELRAQISAEIAAKIGPEIQKLRDEIRKISGDTKSQISAEIERMTPKIEKAVIAVGDQERAVMNKKFDAELMEFAKMAEKRLSQISDYVKHVNIDGTQIYTDYRERVMTGRDKSEHLTTYIDATTKGRTIQGSEKKLITGSGGVTSSASKIGPTYAFGNEY